MIVQLIIEITPSHVKVESSSAGEIWIPSSLSIYNLICCENVKK